MSEKGKIIWMILWQALDTEMKEMTSALRELTTEETMWWRRQSNLGESRKTSWELTPEQNREEWESLTLYE